MKIINFKKKLNYIIAIKTAFQNKVKLILGDNITFIQRTIITGNGKVSIGKSCCFGYSLGGFYYNGLCEFQTRFKKSEIIIGNNVRTNNNLFICSAKKISIGCNTLIGEGVVIIDHDGHGLKPNQRRTSMGNVKQINIGENVWIGNKVIILPGTIIGKNSVIGAGTVLKGVYPENSCIISNKPFILKKI